METSTAVLVALALFIGLCVPYYSFYIRRGKARGHSWFTWWKPRGHSDIGPDIGSPQTRPGVDEGRGARY